MRKPRVLCDVDGVLADFLTPAYAALNKMAGTQLRPEDQKTWDMFDVFDRRYEDAFYAVCNQRGWCKAIPVLPGAQEGFRKLREMADIYIVTSPMNHNETWTHEREAWLKEHFGVDHSRVVHTSAKYLCRGDALIDDRPSNITRWAAENPMGVPFLWAQPYNVVAGVGMRVGDWDNLIGHMKRSLGVD